MSNNQQHTELQITTHLAILKSIYFQIIALLYVDSQHVLTTFKYLLVNEKEKTVKCISIHIIKANLFQKKKLFCFSSLVECTLDIPRVNMLSEIGYWMLMRLATVLQEGGLHQGDKL